MTMKRSSLVFISLLTWLLAIVPMRAELSLDFEPDGTALLGNSMVKLRVTSGTGRADGIRGWHFVPTGYEMVDVLYRQLDADGGHLLGLLWDGVAMGDHKQGRPNCGPIFIPRLAAIDAAGRGAMLMQTAEAEYRLTRTLILRRDLSTLEARFTLENVQGSPVGTSLRLHNVASPGARGQYQAGNDVLFMQARGGLQAWKQDLPLDLFKTTYGSDRCMLALAADQPASIWTRVTPTTPELTDNFAALVNPDHGDGLVFLVEPEHLLGFYNCPNITLEPLFRGIVLQPGERWETRIFISAFSGARGKEVHKANPLAIETQRLTHAEGRLRGEIIPAFRGTLRILSADGSIAAEQSSSPDTALTIDAAVAGDWQLVALDSRGAEIGRLRADGGFELYQPDVTVTEPVRPEVTESVHEPDPATVAAFVAARDYVIQVDATATERVRLLAARMARHLGVGFAPTARYRGKMIAFGSPAHSSTVRNAGLLKHSVDATWPGAGKGVILAYDNFESTAKPLLLVAGSDGDGAYAAAMAFAARHVEPLPPARGWQLWGTPLSTHAYVWSRPSTEPTLDVIRLSAARNEYESAQLVITPWEELTGIQARVEPFVHVESGEELAKPVQTVHRKRTPNPLLRWADAFPLTSSDGWPGTPDALLMRPETLLPAGRSKVLWLTTLVGLNAKPGLYRSAVTVTANGESQRVQVELEVLDFALPATGLKGEAYMAMHLMAADGKTRPAHIDRLIRTLVEHRFRIIHLGEPGMLRWHVSESGAFKGFAAPGFMTSADGALMLDASRFQELVDRIDMAATPFSLEIIVPGLQVLGWPEAIHVFRRSFPDRHADKPERGGHTMQSHHAQEMMELFRQYLESRGLRDRVLVKIGDEPAGFDTWWFDFATAARESGLRFGTAFNSIDWQQAEKSLGSNLALYQPLYQRFDAEFARRAQEAGQQVGWYNCGPPPKIGIGTSAAELRAYYWQAARHKLDFVARWGIQCWGTEGTSPYNVWTFPYAHHHSVLYPEHPEKPAYTVEGRGWIDTAPLDSIRFELIREGIEDADYVRVLRDRIDRAHRQGATQLAEEAEALLESIWGGTFPSLNHYNPPYAEIMEHRRRIAEAIVNLHAYAVDE